MTAASAGAGFLPNARPVQPLDGRQLNQFNFDVNFQNQSVSALNFTLGPTTAMAVAKAKKADARA